MPKEQEKVKKINIPLHKYEEMIALPKNHSSLAKRAGAYSVYVKKEDGEQYIAIVVSAIKDSQ